jgi:hypothetical protein
MRTYTISDLVLYHAVSGGGTEPGLWRRCYHALCEAFGVPPDWPDDQRRRAKASEWIAGEDQPSQLACNFEYLYARERFLKLQLAAFWSFGTFDGGELGARIHARVDACHRALSKQLLELDVLFFEGVYGIDARRVFSERELAERFGMPLGSEQSDAWIESL